MCAAMARTEASAWLDAAADGRNAVVSMVITHAARRALIAPCLSKQLTTCVRQGARLFAGGVFAAGERRAMPGFAICSTYPKRPYTGQVSWHAQLLCLPAGSRVCKQHTRLRAEAINMLKSCVRRGLLVRFRYWLCVFQATIYGKRFVAYQPLVLPIIH